MLAREIGDSEGEEMREDRRFVEAESDGRVAVGERTFRSSSFAYGSKEIPESGIVVHNGARFEI